MDAQTAVTEIRKRIAKNPKLEADMRAAWVSVCDEIEARALQAKMKPKVYEVLHEIETARAAFMIAAADGKFDAAKAKQAAFYSVKL